MARPLEPAANAEIDLSLTDLGPLAWVIEEMRKAVGSATRALKRFVQDSDGLSAAEKSASDASQLRVARQQLHQAAGAMDMVGQAAPAIVLRAMESAVQQCVQRPALCNEDAISRIERAGFGLLQYLETLLQGKPASAVALFPQYRDVQALAGQQRAHPADLWPLEWRWVDPVIAPPIPALAYELGVREQFEHAVLQVIKNKDQAAALILRDLSLGFSAAQNAKQPLVFWKITAAFFEALALDLCPSDVHVKRAISRVLHQYSALVRGELGVADRLAQDLVFFCAQAKLSAAVHTVALDAVRQGFGLLNWIPVDYENSPFGRFDPALLAQARKRIGAVKEAWSSVAGGDLSRVRGLTDQFSLVSDSLVRLHPPSTALAVALTKAADVAARSGAAPSTALAMEVATAVMFLEAAFEELDPADEQLAKRTARLAQRLERVQAGSKAEPLEPWIEELYRRVSDRQTMGSVVGELRTSLSDLERTLDQYFRAPQDTVLLATVPGQLSQMRGVMSVLGLDHAVKAVLRMRDMVEKLMDTTADSAHVRATGIFDKLGNNLGALGLLFDMLNYQPVLAKKLFLFDEDLDELTPMMGRLSASSTSTDVNAPVEVDELMHVVAENHEPESLRQFMPTDFGLPGGDAPDSDHAFLTTTVGISALSVPNSGYHEDKDSSLMGDEELLLNLFDLSQPAPPSVMPLAIVPTPSAQAPETDFEEDDLRGIFLEEAREVVVSGQSALALLVRKPDDADELTVLRRAFHTLKGSSRMVGLNDFGEAAWSLEQVLNTWLADRRAASPELISLSTEALACFGEWANDIASGDVSRWSVRMFQAAAEALRVNNLAQAIRAPRPALAPVVPKVQIAPIMLSSVTVEVEPLTISSEVVSIDDALLIEKLTQLQLQAEARVTAADATTALAEKSPEVTSGEAVSTAPVLPESPPIAPSIVESLVSATTVETATPWPEPVVDRPITALVDVSARVPVPQGLAQLDLDVFSAFLAEQSLTSDSAEPSAIDLDDPEINALFASSTPVEVKEAVSPVDGFLDDEKIKLIGTLRIGIPLYNVYLNEADEWSRRLLTELSEWQLELDHQPLAESTVSLAHSLAGSSATVGFDALSGLARELEHALQWTQIQGIGTPEEGRVYASVAEDIRRLLHQFAAGFLKDPDSVVLNGLRQLHADKGQLPSPSMAGDTVGAMDSSKFDDNVAHVLTLEIPIEPEPELDAKLEPEPTLTPEAVVEVVPQGLPQVVALRGPLPAVSAMVALSASVSDADEDDDIDAVDALDPDLFQFFEEEAVDLLPALGGALRQWVARPDDLHARANALRTLHTLKGSARLAGAMRLGERAHRLETVIESLGEERAQTDSELMGSLLVRFDQMQSNFESLVLSDADSVPETVSVVVCDPVSMLNVQPEQFVHALVPQSIEVSSETSPVALAPTEVVVAVAPAAPMRDMAVAAVAVSGVGVLGSVISGAPVVATLRAASASIIVAPKGVQGQTIRIRAQLLDSLVNQTGEVMMTRSRLEVGVGQLRASMLDLTSNLERLRQQLRDVELQAELQMQSRLAQTKDADRSFDPLEFDRFTRVQELTRMMAESVNDVATVQRNLARSLDSADANLVAQARQARELQRDLLRTRMQEFESISERLYRVIRQASKDSGKQVKLDIVGGAIELDRGVLDRMTPAFEHLLRNAVAHGVEDAASRSSLGKSAVGTITVSLHHEGNDVSITFADDGLGLNEDRILSKAVSLGLLQPGQELARADLLNLIFTPGFSTATQVTELAGRGIGMDVVRSEVLALGGRIETTSVRNAGTQFKLILPLTTAVTRVVMVRMGDMSVGIPANVVEQVRRTPLGELTQAYAAESFSAGGVTMPFFWAGALLQNSARSNESIIKTASVVVLRSAQQLVAIHVDEVLGNQEVVVKNLGPQLSRLPGLSGMTVLPSGAVVLIYNPVALASVYGASAIELQRSVQGDAAAVALVKDPRQGVSKQVPLVLVVDDSITVRRVTQRMLQREGYRVALAVDGIQGLERLREELPTVILSDIEMPRMDGFEFARSVRSNRDWKDLPIITISSRTAEKHREMAREIGVNHYLGKPYGEEELLGLIRGYVMLNTTNAGA